MSRMLLHGDKWEVVINLKPSVKLGSQEVVLALTIQMNLE